MAGNENFNDGASLTSKGWTGFSFSVPTNAAGVGPDSSYALEAFDGEHGVMPAIPCVESPRLTITFDWERTAQSAPSGRALFILTNSEMSGNAPWNSDNPGFLYIGFASNGDGAVFASITPPLGNNGGFNNFPPNIFPTSPTGWIAGQIDVVFSTGVDGGTGQPTADAALTFRLGPDRDTLSTVYNLTGVRIVNPTLYGYALPYTGFDWWPHGRMDNIEWDDYCGDPEPVTPPVIDTTTPCECTPGGANPTEVPDPLLQFAPVYACTGGGTVEQLADLPGIGGCWL